MTPLIFTKEHRIFRDLVKNVNRSVEVIGSSAAEGLSGFESHTDGMNATIIHTHITHTHIVLKDAMNFGLKFVLLDDENGGLCARLCVPCFAPCLPFPRD